MEILFTIISFVLLVGLILSPVLILDQINKLKIKYEFIAYLILGIIVTATITLTFTWCADTSNQILLSNYGYDFNAMNDVERFANVLEENMERVKSLEISIMGIGWPLKAMMTYDVYSPYLLIVYLIVYLVRRYGRKKEHIAHIV